MRPVRILLRQLIDYAGLFPPAALGMEQAVRNYSIYRTGRSFWVLGRFIVPASRLAEFETCAASFLSGTSSDSPWLLSALAGDNLESEFQTILDFNARYSRPAGHPLVQIDTVEIKAPSLEHIGAAAGLLPQGLQAYFEIPSSADPAPLIAAIRQIGARAKVRTGGLTPESIPPAADVERFLRACSAAGLPFKATAGLHHAVRSVYRLTYDADSPSGMMHGFLNVFLASAFIRSGLENLESVRLLEEQSPGDLHFDEKGVGWRSHWISTDELEHTRRDFAIAFGSCSFDEPVEDLERLQLL